MKNIFYKVIVFLLIAVSIQSCRKEEIDVPELGRDKMKSYSDIFDSFWDQMNNNYLYFYEKGDDVWANVYETYSPKFAELKTFNDPDADYDEARSELHLVFKYFAEIVGEYVIDQHFDMGLQIPLPSRGTFAHDLPTVERQNFGSGMKFTYSEENGFAEVVPEKNNVMLHSDFNALASTNQFVENSIFYKVLHEKNENMYFACGRLKEDPSTLYIRLSAFLLSPFMEQLLADRLPELVDISNQAGINEDVCNEIIRLDPVKGQEYVDRMKKLITDLKTMVSSTMASAEYANYLRAKREFEETENPTNLIASFAPLEESRGAIEEKFHADFINYFTGFWDYFVQSDVLRSEELVKKYTNFYIAFRSTIKRLVQGSDYYDLSYEINPNEGQPFIAGLKERLIENGKDYEVFTKCFNLLSNGTIENVIIDLRGNGGGRVTDARFFIDRFITKKRIWGYQRIKEGNGRRNYSPWLPEYTWVHPNGVKQNIPICLLVDERSASMSEMTCLQLRTQGDHVTLIGDQTVGATAGLADANIFNGGGTASNRVFYLRLPNMAYKDVNGNIIEGVGVIPDIKVIPTVEEVNAYPSGGDPVLEAAKRKLGI